MEGPYRDLGAGFARLAGTEGLRRTPVSLRSVEDALFELLRNARDAGASNIYVASILKARRYRSLTVLDDGAGIPETHAHLVFEPGVTTRHLSPVQEPAATTRATAHGAGLALHHIKQASVSAEVLSASSPTAIRAIFDTRQTLPEKSLQSTSKPSGSNLLAVLSRFADATGPTSHKPPPRLYHGSPAMILSRLLHDQIIQISEGTAVGLREEARALGLEVSLRTSQRVLAGGVAPARGVGGAPGVGGSGRGARGKGGGGSAGVEGPILTLGDEELEELSGILRRVARASYLDLSGLAAEGRPGEIVIKARVYEPEEAYEDE